MGYVGQGFQLVYLPICTSLGYPEYLSTRSTPTTTSLGYPEYLSTRSTHSTTPLGYLEYLSTRSKPTATWFSLFPVVGGA